jgi:ATP-dependent DNA ligase
MTNKSIEPMLAYDLEQYINTLQYPVYVQPKLDGYRCLTYCNPVTSEVIFFSRQGKVFSYLYHIRKNLLKIFKNKNKILPFFIDGELFITDSNIPNPIYLLRSFLGRKSMTSTQLKEHEIIHYHVFDAYFPHDPELSFKNRWKWILKHFPNRSKSSLSHCVELVPTLLVHNEHELLSLRDHFLEEGQEGIIVRKPAGIYRRGYKSKNILRSKKIFSNKFVIANYREGLGKDKGSVIWVLQCKKSTKRTFQARPMGTLTERRKWFAEGKKWIGKEVRVKFFNKDENGCVRRNPVAIMD